MDNNNEAVYDIFDINWSNDGTVIAAGFEKSVVMLDMRKILSQNVESIINNKSGGGG
jgi:hypothetical protein